MNRYPLLRLLALAALPLLLGQCASGPPPAPGDSAYHGKQTTAYRNGYHHGYMDGANRLDPSFERYHEEYAAKLSNVFSEGYRAGYEAGRHNAPAAAGDEEQAFQNGRDAGHSDAQNALRPNPARYRDQYSAGSEKAFREGYAKGFEEERKE
jgi:hypothetical protein